MTVDQAIATLSQSDPIIKLLQEVKLGRMKPSDAGLRAIIEAWLDTYRKVFENGQSFDQIALNRLDPSPRVEVLIEAGVLAADNPQAAALRTAFQQARSSAK
jgi:rhamnose utilization protein RhaD (predicted bifunctional aldolase and dehydrogenase)